MKRTKRILLGVFIGMGIVVGGIWVLGQTASNWAPPVFRGHTLDYWSAQANATDAAVSNQASVVVNAEIIPRLAGQMFHDTNDSQLRMTLVSVLNGLPGIEAFYTEAPQRRAEAARAIGELGPAAKAAIPALIQALQSGDTAVHEAAIQSLGGIHSEPDKVIPLLMKYLDDEDLNDEAATALGNYGSLARVAIPKIIPLLHAADDDAQIAAAKALKKIDPDYASATNAPAVNAK